MADNEPVKVATAPAVAAEPVKKRYDGLAPLSFPPAICSNCGMKMTFSPHRDKQSRITRALYFCDQCEYGFEVRPEYMAGTIVKYEEPGDRRGRN